MRILRYSHYFYQFMKLVQIQFAPWDKKYVFAEGEMHDLKIGEEVVVDTEFGPEIGEVAGFEESSENLEEVKNVLRRITEEDVAKLPGEDKKKEAMEVCEALIKKYNLPMKLIDVRFALSGSRLNFAFVADGRVDFRQLVKDLTGQFNSSIRLTQIGSRDEARMNGDCGPCGKSLCCRDFIKDFSSITSEMAECQQVVHRGSERISGMCGRLMCCLAYEYEGYKELAGKLPPIGTKVNVDGKRGEVIGHHVLKQSVDVRFSGNKDEDNMVLEVDLNRHKKKK